MLTPYNTLLGREVRRYSCHVRVLQMRGRRCFFCLAESFESYYCPRASALQYSSFINSLISQQLVVRHFPQLQQQEMITDIFPQKLTEVAFSDL